MRDKSREKETRQMEYNSNLNQQGEKNEHNDAESDIKERKREARYCERGDS